MSDSQIIQSPIIGSVLRKALSLDASGGLPMDMVPTVVPVVVVDDVREEVQQQRQRYQGFAERSAVAAQYSVAGVVWQQYPDVARLIKITSMTISSSVAQFFYVGLADSSHPWTTTPTTAQRKVSALNRSIGAAMPAVLTTANAPAVFSGVSRLVYVSGLAPVVVDLRDAPLFITNPNQSIYAQAGTVNTSIYVTFDWEEELRT